MLELKISRKDYGVLVAIIEDALESNQNHPLQEELKSLLEELPKQVEGQRRRE